MSVPVWKRKVSSAQFIYEVYTLNIRLGEILMNKPQKYKPNYADDIIKTALSCLEHLQIADSVYLSKYSTAGDYELRREHLLTARGQLEHIATASYIFLELVKRHDHARYMDDSYIIHPDLQYLAQCLDIVREALRVRGITMNERKTLIRPLTDDFVYLKKRVHIEDTGRVVLRLTRENVNEERKRIVFMREEYDAGRMPPSSIWQSYQSWRGYAKKYNGYRTVGAMDRFFADTMKGIKFDT